MADRFLQYAWILLALAAACFLSMFFVAAGVIAAALGLICLVLGLVLRLMPRERRAVKVLVPEAPQVQVAGGPPGTETCGAEPRK